MNVMERRGRAVRVNESVIQSLADWLFHISTEDNRVISHVAIANRLAFIRQQRKHPKAYQKITQGELGGIVSLCRSWLEENRKTTLYNIKGIGYKIADQDELAMYTAKFVKRTILYADRTGRLVKIVDKARIPGALKKVFSKNQVRIRNLSEEGQEFVTKMIDYLKENDNGEPKKISIVKR